MITLPFISVPVSRNTSLVTRKSKWDQSIRHYKGISCGTQHYGKGNTNICWLPKTRWRVVFIKNFEVSANITIAFTPTAVEMNISASLLLHFMKPMASTSWKGSHSRKTHEFSYCGGCFVHAMPTARSRKMNYLTKLNCVH